MFAYFFILASISVYCIHIFSDFILSVTFDRGYRPETLFIFLLFGTGIFRYYHAYQHSCKVLVRSMNISRCALAHCILRLNISSLWLDHCPAFQLGHVFEKLRCDVYGCCFSCLIYLIASFTEDYLFMLPNVCISLPTLFT